MEAEAHRTLSVVLERRFGIHWLLADNDNTDGRRSMRKVWFSVTYDKASILFYA